MVMKPGMLGVACLILFGSVGVAHAKCKATSVSFSGNMVETEGEMTVVAGTSCSSGVSGIQGSLTEVRITQQPKVGKAGVENMRPYYTAKPGYQGPDEFAYTYFGKDQYGGPMRVSVKRKIAVVPEL